MPAPQVAEAAQGRGGHLAERLVGILIVVALAVGVMILINRPSGSPATGADPTSTAGATVRPTTAVADVTPEPEIPLVGSGIITFGTAYDPDTLEIPEPLTRFKRTFPEIAWSAELTRPPGDTSVTLVIASRSSSGVESSLIEEEVPVSNPEFSIFANAVDLAFLLDNKAGTYVMRYIADGEVLAEGSFTLVK